MLSYEEEIESLARDGVIARDRADALIVVERRDVFSLYAELRILLYAGVMLVVAAVGTYLARNYRTIGPLTLTLAIFLAAAACIAFAEARRRHWRGWKATLLDDYILLLGALLLGAGAGFAESQFHLFGDRWQWHLLILAIIYAGIAYRFESRVILSLSITSLAAWFGVDRNLDRILSAGTVYGSKALTVAVLLLGWRSVHSAAKGTRSFLPLFEHYAANLALIGALMLTFDRQAHWPGFLLAAGLAGASIAIGFRRRREAFVFYGLLYGWVALSDVVVEDLLERQDALIMLYFIASAIALGISIFMIHRRFGEES